MVQLKTILRAPAPAPPAPVRPAHRDEPVLRELIRDDGILSFQGLRRRLGIHQETLKRSLRRLEEQQLIEQDEAGYRATDDGRAATQANPETLPTTMHLNVPADIDLADVIEDLAGRWFKGLWWLGRSDGPGETTLMWVDDDGNIVRMRIGAGTIRIEGTPHGALLAALAQWL